MRVLLTRVLILLLALRAFLAPYSYRSTMRDHAPRYSLIMRVCTWPHQRLERFSSSSKVLKLYEGKNRAVTVPAGRLGGLLTRWTNRSDLRRPLIASDPLFRSLARFSSVLRC